MADTVTDTDMATVPRSPKRNKAGAQPKQQKATSDSSPPFFAPIPQPPRSGHLKAKGDASPGRCQPRRQGRCPTKAKQARTGCLRYAGAGRIAACHSAWRYRLNNNLQAAPQKAQKKRGMLTHPTSANIKLKYCILINFLRAVGATAMLARMGFLPRRGKHGH